MTSVTEVIIDKRNTQPIYKLQFPTLVCYS